MKHLNLKHFKQLLLSLMALACVTTTYAQGNSYDDLCKPTHSTSGNKRCQIKGEILEQTNLADNSPLVFEPTGSNASQNWANIDNEIKAYPGATFKLKVTYSDAWGSLTVFQLRSNNTPSSEDKIFGTYEGSWYSGVPGTNELYTNIAKDTESGIKASQEDKTVTCPITIPSDIRNGELVVIRFIVCKTADGATYDGTPCVSNATELNYCDYIVRIVEKEQEGLEVTWKKPENGNITVKNGTEVLESPATVEPGTKLTIVPAPASGRYELGTLTANDTPITLNEGNYEVTINENTVIAATFDIAKYKINWNEPVNGTIKVVYANDESQEVTKGSKVQLDTELKVIAEPSTSGYVLNRVYYVYENGTEYDITKGDNGYTFTVQETTNGIKTIYINAVFEKVVQYRITWPGSETMQGNSLKVVFAGTETEVIDLETLVPEGTELEIIPTTVPGYHLSTLSYTISGLQNVPFTIGNEPYTFIVERGTEDPKMGYFVIISAGFTPDTYTLSTSVNPAEGGSVSVTTTDDTPIEGSVTHGQTIVITASENDGYKLQSLDVKGATKVDSQENQYTVEGDVTVTATFVEDAPVETWSEVHFNTMSGSKSGEIDLSKDPYYVKNGTETENKWNVIEYGASNTDNKYGPYIKQPKAGYYLAYKYNVEKEATYRFSFLHKKGETTSASVKLQYTTDLANTYTDASEAVDVPKIAAADPGKLIQSQSITLEPGDYYFIYYISSASMSGKNGAKIRIADFKLEMLDGSAVEPTPEYTVTLNKPENGNLSVTYNNGEKDVTVSTNDATEPQTFNVAENTKLTVTVTPADGYQLETLSPEMTEVADNGNVYEYTVIKAVTIEATFVEEVTFDYVPVPIKSGFNTDVIAEAKPSADHTSGTLDSQGWVLFTSDIQEEGALPLDLTTVDGIPYKMADVTSNNAAVLKGTNTEATLVFQNPAKAEEVRLLSISAEKTSTMEVTVNYDDKTSQTETFTIEDWFSDYSNQGEAYYGLNRIITKTIIGYTKDNIDRYAKFRFFEQVVNTDPEKTIVSVKVVNKSTGSQTPSVFGVTVLGELLEVEPIMHSITVNKPTNGDMLINYTVDGNMEEIDTSVYEGESEVYSIPENTVLTITTYEENGYELEKLLPEEGMVEKPGKGGILYEYTVKGDVTIEAIFKEILYGKVSVNAPEETQGSIEIQRYNPDEDLWVNAEESFLEQVEFDTELRAKVEAKTGYNLVSVMKNQEELSTEEDGYYYFTVDAKAITISAEFEQEQGTYYTITIDVTKPEQGSVKVEMSENGEIKNVANGDKVKENTELTITPEANEGYIFTTLLIDNKPVQLTDGSYKMTVTKDTKIAPKFKEVVSSFELNWVEPENGTLKLYKTSDLENPLTQKSSIEVGTEIKVVVEENEGYDISKVYYKYFPTEKTVDIAKGENGYVFTVEADNENPNNSIIYIYADFEPETYTLTTEVNPAEGGSVSVTVNGATVEGSVKYGDVITVTVTENPRYKHESTVVEGAEEIDGQAGEYTVKGAVTITVTFTEDTSSINSIENGTVYYNAAEEVLYTGNAVSVRVYDLSGRLVLNAENQATVSLAELADGVYTAIVGNVVLKLKK